MYVDFSTDVDITFFGKRCWTFIIIKIESNYAWTGEYNDIDGFCHIYSIFTAN